MSVAELEMTTAAFIEIELVTFPHPVLFEEIPYKTRASQSHMCVQDGGERAQGVGVVDVSGDGGSIGGSGGGGLAKGQINEFHIVSDWEPEMINPAEDKYRYERR